MEDKSGDDETKKNSNHTIADVIEICVGRVSLEYAVEKSEGNLQSGITDPLASSRDPAGDGTGTGDDHNERRDRFHVRHQKDNG